MNNQEIVDRFFEFLRQMIMSTAKNMNDPGELQELTYLANYIKETIGDALEQAESGRFPILSFSAFGSRDGKTDGRFLIAKNEQIIRAWKLQCLAELIGKAKDTWSNTLEFQPDEANNFDMTPYGELMKEIAGKKKINE